MITGRLLDTHCHVGAYADPVETLRSAESANVAIVVVTEGPDEYRRLRTRLGSRRHVTVALGLHPLRASSFGPNDLARFFRLVPQTAWIGEVGLDYSRTGAHSSKAQQRVFDVVLTEAQPGQHPLTVHSRGAEQEVIQRLAQAQIPAILHWYTGPIKAIDSALDAGLYFSINIAMTRSKRFAALLKAIPRERILLETDGPYAKDQGQPAQPASLHRVVARLARAWDTDPDEAEQLIVSNQETLMGTHSAP